MNTRIHIERLVVEEGLLGRRDAPRFEAALASELDRLRHNRPEPRRSPPDAVQMLAHNTAAAIHDRMPKP